MPINLKIELLVFVILFCITILYLVKKDKLIMKYAIIWLLSALAMFLAVIIPNLIESISTLLGFQLVSNMVFLFALLILLVLSLSLTVIVSKQSEKIRLLIQEVSIIKIRSNQNGKGKSK